jgi:hypothetical protein
MRDRHPCSLVLCHVHCAQILENLSHSLPWALSVERRQKWMIGMDLHANRESSMVTDEGVLQPS